MDTVIECRALLEGGLASCCIGIEDGRIAKVAKTIGKADKRYDFSDRIVMPAGVDLHVHFRDPGMTAKEDFRTGSIAAACGGVSYVMDMPNTKPPVRSVSDVKEKISLASKKSHVDFGIAALLDSRSDAKKLAAEATAFKVYLGETTGGLGIPAGDLGKIISAAAQTGTPIMIHAEHLKQLDEKLEENLRDHDLRRAEDLEIEAARRVIAAKSKDSRMHLLHVTQPEIIRDAGSAGISVEVTPHHLLLDTDSPLGAMGKINPPLRSKRTRMRLWEAFASGKADSIGSDHSPHTIAEKEQEFDTAPSGMPGVETLLPLMLQKVADRKLDISLLSRCSSARPAEICGLNKGRIAAGYDADLIVVDLRKSSTIRADDLHSKCGWTPYEGMSAVFPIAAFIRGEEVARDREIVGDRVGRFVGKGAGAR